MRAALFTAPRQANVKEPDATADVVGTAHICSQIALIGVM